MGNPHPSNGFKVGNTYGSGRPFAGNLSKETTEKLFNLTPRAVVELSEILNNSNKGIHWMRLKLEAIKILLNKFQPDLQAINITATVNDNRILEFVNAINTRLEGISIPIERTGTEGSISGSVQGQS